MASDESMSMTPNSSMYSSSSMHDIGFADYLLDDDYDDDPLQLNDMYDDHEDEDEGDEEPGNDHVGVRMSRLTLETSEGDDATAELSDHIDDKEKEEGGGGGSDVNCDDDVDDGGISTSGFTRGIKYLSLPGTPTRRTPRRRAGSTRSVRMEYASETEAARCRHGGRARNKICAATSDSSFHPGIWSRKNRETGLDRAWEMKRCHGDGSDGPDSHSGGSSPCVVVRPRGPGASCMWMDMEEVKACRDLGLELPCDWTVEIPPGAFTAAVSADAGGGGGGDSPINNWRLSHPDEDQWDMKARLRVWAQAVALASASRLSS